MKLLRVVSEAIGRVRERCLDGKRESAKKGEIVLKKELVRQLMRLSKSRGGECASQMQVLETMLAERERDIDLKDKKSKTTVLLMVEFASLMCKSWENLYFTVIKARDDETLCAAYRLIRILLIQPDWDHLLVQAGKSFDIGARTEDSRFFRTKRIRFALPKAKANYRQSDLTHIRYPKQTRTLSSSSTQKSRLSQCSEFGRIKKLPLVCLMADSYLKLHHEQLVHALTSGPLFSADCKEAWRELLLSLLAESYYRIPMLRDCMLTLFQNKCDTKACMSTEPSFSDTLQSHTKQRSNSTDGNYMDEYVISRCKRMRYFQNECFPLMIQRVTSHRFLCAMLILQCLYKSIAKGSFLKKPAHPLLHSNFLQNVGEMYDCQLKQLESVMQSESNALETYENLGIAIQYLGQDSFAHTVEAQYFCHLESTLAAIPDLLHDVLLTILKRTKYLVPYHVALLLQKLDSLVKILADYFSLMERDRDWKVILLFCLVFQYLLESEHVLILHDTQRFLIRHMQDFSDHLQAQLLRLLEQQFIRLFFHWSRHVRYLYSLILLYIVYPENRMHLCPESDAIFMGDTEISRLLEISCAADDARANRWTHFESHLVRIAKIYTRDHKTRTRPSNSQAQFHPKRNRFTCSERCKIKKRASLPDSMRNVSDILPDEQYPHISSTHFKRCVEEYCNLVREYYTSPNISLHDKKPDLGLKTCPLS